MPRGLAVATFIINPNRDASSSITDLITSAGLLSLKSKPKDRADYRARRASPVGVEAGVESQSVIHAHVQASARSD
jgi:hypothetical protein